MTINRRRRLAPALIALGAVVTLGAAHPVGAAKPPSYLLEGGDRWFTHDVGWFPVVRGPAEVVLNGHRTLAGTLAATIQPDDHTMPVAGECESGITFVYVDGPRHADTMLSSAGEICGHSVQPPTSVVTHTFTGTATIEESGRRRLEGREAFLEVRMAQDGRANVLATTG